MFLLIVFDRSLDPSESANELEDDLLRPIEVEQVEHYWCQDLEKPRSRIHALDPVGVVGEPPKERRRAHATANKHDGEGDFEHVAHDGR